MTRHSLLRLAACNILLISVVLIICIKNNQNVSKSYAASLDFPSQYFAPEVDATLAGNPFPSVISQASGTAGTKYYKLGFITTRVGQCQAQWGGVNSLNYMQPDIANLRASGGDIVLNFGGYAAGNPDDPSVDPQQQEELAMACPTLSSLRTQYQTAITAYHVTHVAFDIEGDALVNQKYANSIIMRNQAILGLQSGVPGTRLCVEYTLTGTPIGLTDNGLVLLKDAIDKGINICLVNILALNYGSTTPVNQPGVMGQYAVEAVKELFTQLKFLLPGRSNSQVWSMIGVTIMNGANNSSGEGGREIFSLQDVQTLLPFALQNGIRELSMRELHRDQPPPNGNVIAPTDTVTATPNMNSGIQQKPYEFSIALNTFTAGLPCPPGQPGGSSPSIGIPPASAPVAPPSGVNVGLPSDAGVTPSAVTPGNTTGSKIVPRRAIAKLGNPNCIPNPSGTNNPGSTNNPGGINNPGGTGNPGLVVSQNCTGTSNGKGKTQPSTPSNNSSLPQTKVRTAPNNAGNITIPSGSSTTSSSLSLLISRNAGQLQVGQQVTYALTACNIPQAKASTIVISDIISSGLSNLRPTGGNWQIVYNSMYGNGSTMIVALYTGPRTMPAGSALPPFTFSGVLTPAAVPLVTSFGVVLALDGTAGAVGPSALTGPPGLPATLGLSLNAKVTGGAATVDTLSVQSTKSQ